MSDETPYQHSGLTGGITIRLRDEVTLDSIARKFIPNFEADRLEPIALRVLSGKETIVTVYAVDKDKQAGSADSSTVPVKKFKLENISTLQLYNLVSEINFTVNTGNYNIEDIEVVNK